MCCRRVGKRQWRISRIARIRRSPACKLESRRGKCRELEAIESHGLDVWAYRDTGWFVRDPTAPHVAREQPYYLDVTHPHANEGGVVLAMSKLLNISAEEIATIGDMPNDVLMFEKSGVSIAMGNASAEVQAAATYVTATNEQEGFARAIEEVVLNRRSAKA